MKPEDLKDSMYDYEYSQICECGKSHKVFTQNNHCAEYETTIFIVCDCGQLVEFELPVN